MNSSAVLEGEIFKNPGECNLREFSNTVNPELLELSNDYSFIL